MVDVTESVIVQTASCLDTALVPAEQVASRLATALGSPRCPLAVTTARRPVFPPCRKEVEGIMMGGKRQPRGMHNKRRTQLAYGMSLFW